MKERLHCVGCLPESLRVEVITHRCCCRGYFQVEIPMHDVEPVNHQIGQRSSAKIPEPSPIPKPVGIKRLITRLSEKAFPVDSRGIDLKSHGAAAKLIAVPRHVYFVDLSELT